MDTSEVYLGEIFNLFQVVLEQLGDGLCNVSVPGYDST